MKTVLRGLFLSVVVLYLASLTYPGLVVEKEAKTLVVASLALLLLNRIVKPLIKLFLLPINLLTLGIFGWLANVATVFLLTRVVAGVAVIAVDFRGLSLGGFVAPPMHISVLMSYVLASVTISVVSSLLGWLLKK